MIPNAKEKELSIRLHELLKAKGELPEIREGDWFDRGNWSGAIGIALKDKLLFYNDPCYRDNFILLLSWARCRELLRKRGYFLAVVNDCNPGKVYFEFAEDKFIKTGKSFGKWGQTDLEAILAVMVRVTEEEK